MPLGAFRIRIAWLIWALWDNSPWVLRRKRREALAEAQRLRDEATRAHQREQDMREIECHQFLSEFEAWWQNQGVK
jgi:hypothetical protein